MIIETKKISELKPSPYNPRKASKKQEQVSKKKQVKLKLN